MGVYDAPFRFTYAPQRKRDSLILQQQGGHTHMLMGDARCAAGALVVLKCLYRAFQKTDNRGFGTNERRGHGLFTTPALTLSYSP